MKPTLICLFVAGAMLVTARAADVTDKITDVHVCCHSCVVRAQDTVKKVAGATCDPDMEEGTITVTGPDVATVQKATDALLKAGFYGKSTNPDIKISKETGAKGVIMTRLDVSGVHLCCGSCVKAVTAIVKGVPGVTGVTGVVKDAKTFQVAGNFKDSDVFDALQKAGLTGKEGAPAEAAK